MMLEENSGSLLLACRDLVQSWEEESWQERVPGVGNQESKRYFITVCTVAGGGSSFTPAAKIPTCPKLKHWRRDILNLCTCCV